MNAGFLSDCDVATEWERSRKVRNPGVSYWKHCDAVVSQIICERWLLETEPLLRKTSRMSATARFANLGDLDEISQVVIFSIRWFLKILRNIPTSIWCPQDAAPGGRCPSCPPWFMPLVAQKKITKWFNVQICRTHKITNTTNLCFHTQYIHKSLPLLQHLWVRNIRTHLKQTPTNLICW